MALLSGLFVGDDAEGLGVAVHPAEAGLRQAADDAGGGALAEGAGGVADVVEEAAAGPEDAVDLAVERAGVELAGEAERRRVVEDAVKGAVGERGDLLGDVADDLGDPGVLEEGARPGIVAGDLE